MPLQSSKLLANMKYIIFLLLLITSAAYGQDLTVTPTGIIKNNTLDLGVYSLKTEVTELQAALYTLQVKVNSMSGGGTGGELSPKDITASTYTVTQSDANTPLRFLNKCTVTFSSQIKVPFSCRIQMAGGQVTFIGTNIQSKFNYKRIQTTNAWVRVTAVYNGILAIDGDLKQ